MGTRVIRRIREACKAIVRVLPLEEARVIRAQRTYCPSKPHLTETVRRFLPLRPRISTVPRPPRLLRHEETPLPRIDTALPRLNLISQCRRHSRVQHLRHILSHPST